jgi:cytoskeletal protein CcmA (bactofilin family)
MTEASVIGAGTVISGHVRGQGSLEILGRVEGDVSVTGNVVIGPEGRVRGSVNGAELRIAGHVQGDLRGAIAVLLEAGARVVGDISAPRVGIAPGALARGHVQTDGEPALAAARTPATAVRPVVPPTRTVSSTALAPATPKFEPKPVVLPAKVEAKAPPVPAKYEAKAPLPPPPKLAPPKPEIRKAEPPRIAAAPPQAEFTPVRPLKPEPRRPPPPVVPVLSKGVKAKKKKSQD